MPERCMDVWNLLIRFSPSSPSLSLTYAKLSSPIVCGVYHADRKAGHCLLSDDGRIWSIDHGLTFHPAFKVRTVMLEFWGEPIPEPLLAELETLGTRLEPKDPLVAQLGEVLTTQEIDSLRTRLGLILNDPVLPQLDPYQNVPWPWV